MRLSDGQASSHPRPSPFLLRFCAVTIANPSIRIRGSSKTAVPDDSKSYKCTKSACSYVTNNIQDMFSHAGNCGINASSCRPQPHNAQLPKEPVTDMDAYLSHDGIVEDVVDVTQTSNLDEILHDR